MQQNREKWTVKHPIKKPILHNFANLSTTILPKFWFIAMSCNEWFHKILKISQIGRHQGSTTCRKR